MSEVDWLFICLLVTIGFFATVIKCIAMKVDKLEKEIKYEDKIKNNK